VLSIRAGKRWGAVVLVLVDVVGEIIKPGIMDDGVGVPVSVGRDTRLVGALRTDEMAFAVVVPGYDFDEGGLEVNGLLPALVPEVAAAPEPVFVVLIEAACYYNVSRGYENIHDLWKGQNILLGDW